jgi:hypothetical protein
LKARRASLQPLALDRAFRFSSFTRIFSLDHNPEC